GRPGVPQRLHPSAEVLTGLRGETHVKHQLGRYGTLRSERSTSFRFRARAAWHQDSQLWELWGPELFCGIMKLPQQFPTLFDDPEARLYAGLAELTITSKILLTETTAFNGLPLDVQFLIGVTAPQEAIQNFELGLAETPGAEARSLNGAFQVF